MIAEEVLQSRIFAEELGSETSHHGPVMSPSFGVSNRGLEGGQDDPPGEFRQGVLWNAEFLLDFREPQRECGFEKIDGLVSSSFDSSAVNADQLFDDSREDRGHRVPTGCRID